MKQLAIAAAALMAFATTAAAKPIDTNYVIKAQYTGVYCQAQSQFAWGEWYGPNYTIACRQALAACSVRTPVGYNCVVTRYYYY